MAAGKRGKKGERVLFSATMWEGSGCSSNRERGSLTSCHMYRLGWKLYEALDNDDSAGRKSVRCSRGLGKCT